MAYARLCIAGLTPSMPPLPCNEAIGIQQHINFTTSFDVSHSKSKQHPFFFVSFGSEKRKFRRNTHTGVSCEMTSHQSPASFESEQLWFHGGARILLVSSRCSSSAPRSLADEMGRGGRLWSFGQVEVYSCQCVI
jgi:hypothetical protein